MAENNNDKNKRKQRVGFEYSKKIIPFALNLLNLKKYKEKDSGLLVGTVYIFVFFGSMGLIYGGIEFLLMGFTLGFEIALVKSTYGFQILLNGLKGILYSGLTMIVFAFILDASSFVDYDRRNKFEKIVLNFLGTFIIGLLFILIFFSASLYDYFNDLKREYRANYINQQQSLSEVKKSLVSESNNIGSYKKELSEIVTAIEEGRNEFNKSEIQLKDSLKKLEKYSAYLDDALFKVDSAISQKTTIDLKIAQIQKILDGSEPIAKKDMNGSLFIGFFLGVCANFFTSFLYELFRRVRAKL